MKESINNAIKDILHSEIITKTKSGIYDLVTGMKNLFRHSSAGAEEDKAGSKNINNYLKSPEEIEAEFRYHSASQAETIHTEIPEKPSAIYSTTINTTGIISEIQIIEEPLPDYMEENY